MKTCKKLLKKYKAAKGEEQKLIALKEICEFLGDLTIPDEETKEWYKLLCMVPTVLSRKEDFNLLLEILKTDDNPTSFGAFKAVSELYRVQAVKAFQALEQLAMGSKDHAAYDQAAETFTETTRLLKKVIKDHVIENDAIELLRREVATREWVQSEMEAPIRHMIRRMYR